MPRKTNVAMMPESSLRGSAASGARADNLIFGTGEMADLTRAFDWGRTPLGPVDQWDTVLLNTVNLLLSSRHPMFLWWGDDLIQIYNDAYRPSIREDKHPSALGQRGEECWREIWPIIGPQIEGVMTRGEATWHEDQLVPILRNGRLEDVYWTYGYSPVRDSKGMTRGTLVVCTETTGRVSAHRKLQEESERLASLFQQAPAFFALLHGPEHIFEFTNAQYQQLIGHRDVIGKTIRNALPEIADQGFYEILDQVYRTGEPYIGSGNPVELVRSASSQSELRFLDFVYQPRREDDGAISGIIVLGVDVTERKRAEQALLQSEKLAVVGRLASSIAHEINNPLESVTNLVYLARAAATSPDTRSYLDSADIELKRVAAIVNQTLRFHRQASFPRAVTPAGLFKATLDLYESRLRNCNITVETRGFAEETLDCFEGDIRQALSNLVANAIDSMRSGGCLVVRARAGTDWPTGAKGVFLTVADTGVGMDAETKRRAFEPFFTTKGISGSGLGLWISAEIMQRHKGRILIRSSEDPGRSGTVVALVLRNRERLPGIGIVFDMAGLLVAGIVSGELPEDPGVFGIERVVEVFRIADGHHGKALCVVDVPASVVVLAVEPDLLHAVGLESGEGEALEVVGDGGHAVVGEKEIDLVLVAGRDGSRGMIECATEIER